MKRLMIWTSLLLLGGVVGAGVTAYVAYRWVVDEQRIQNAMLASGDAETLARLRQREADRAIDFLETRMDGTISWLHSMSHVAPSRPDPSAVRCLQAVSVYRTAYPPSGAYARIYSDVLRGVPPMSADTPCTWGICKLNKRLAVGAATAPRSH